DRHPPSGRLLPAPIGEHRAVDGDVHDLQRGEDGPREVRVHDGTGLEDPVPAALRPVGAVEEEAVVLEIEIEVLGRLDERLGLDVGPPHRAVLVYLPELHRAPVAVDHSDRTVREPCDSQPRRLLSSSTAMPDPSSNAAVIPNRTSAEPV